MPSLGIGLHLSMASGGGSAPDTTAPVITTLSYDGGTLTVTLDVTEASGAITVVWATSDTTATPTYTVGGGWAGDANYETGSYAASSGSSANAIDITETTPDGSRKLTIYAYDASNNLSDADSVTITVANGPETITFDASTWISFAADLAALETEGVYAFRAVNKFTDGGAGDTHFLNSGATLGDSYSFIWDANGDQSTTKIESNTGGNIIIAATGSDWVIDAAHSVFIRVSSGDTEVIIDGVSVGTSATTFATHKALRYLNSADAAGGSARALQLIGGVWISTAAGAADGTTGLGYSDFFDGTDQPIFTSGSVGGFAPDVALTTVAEVNAYGGTTGTAT